MCGRYLTPNEQALERVFHVGRHNWQGLETRYNVAPTSRVPVVLRLGDELVGEQARWGLIPAWWNKDSLPTLSFNARSEEAAHKPLWRLSLRTQRCLMPALGWYEWNEHESVPTTRGRRSHEPYYFHHPDEPVLAIAGLWSLWRSPAGTDDLVRANRRPGGAGEARHVAGRVRPDDRCQRRHAQELGAGPTDARLSGAGVAARRGPESEGRH